MLTAAQRQDGMLKRADRSCLRLPAEKSIAPSRWPSSRVRDEEGSTLVEFALSASMLFAMLFGIIGISFGFYSYNFVSDAAREATRWAIVRGSSCSILSGCGASSSDIQTYVRSLGYPGITANSLTVTSTWLSASSTQPTTWTACASTCNAPGNAVQVQVKYAFALDIPFFRDNALNISSTSQMVISN